MTTWVCTRQNELAHYGVKGMKWGVRRYQNKDGSLTSAGRKRYNDDVSKKEKQDKVETDEERKRRIRRNVIIGASAVAAGLLVIGGMKCGMQYQINVKTLRKASFGVQEISTRVMDLNKMSDKDIVVKKGTKFQRISSKKFEDYSGEGKAIYTSYLKSDNAIYMHDMPDNINQWRKQHIINDGGKDAYKHVLKMNKDIKVASPKKVLEAYEHATGNKSPKHYQYMNFMIDLVDREKPENKKFFDFLKKAGYNAIVDENDGGGTYTKSPLILINPAADVENVTSKTITKLDQIWNILTYSDK